MTSQRRLATLAALALLPAALHAQQPADPALAEGVAALRECAALGEQRKAAQALAPGRRAEAIFKARVTRDPRDADALVALARVTSQCLLPSADFAGQGELSARAIELLQQALELRPDHWVARFVLASIYLRSPAFLGRGPLAARELDELLRRQGDRTDDPMFARTFELRGMMLSRQKLADSARAVWVRGVRLFPADTALRALAERAATEATAAPSADTSATTAAGTASRPATLTAVRVVTATSAPTAATPSVREVGRAAVLMTAGSTADVLQAVGLQPGATRVGDGSDVYTRGGGASETATVVDGGRLLSIARFEGLNGGTFGALDPWVVKSARYASGAFSARWGNALSGVLEIETDGRPRARGVRAGLSMAQAAATVRAPVGRKAGAWASARVANTGLILATHGRGEEFDGAPHSVELVASGIANPSPTSELRATAMVERDDSRRIVDAAGWSGPFHAAGDARAVMLSSRWMPGAASVVVRTNLAANARTSAWEFGVLRRDRDERALVARTDVEWAAAPALALRGGVEHGRLARTESGRLPAGGDATPGAPTRALDGERASTLQLGAYGEAEITRGSASLLAGLRADRLPGESQATIDPRLTLSVRQGAWTGRVGGGLFHQGRWQSAPAIPDAATPAGTPREARHVVVGVEREGTTTLRAEAYDKRYDDYAALGAGPQVGAARARGVDVLAQRAVGSRLTGWVGWSLLDAAVRLRDGRRARSPYDVTHTATASATLAMGADWSAGATARYGTGAPVTPVTGATLASDGRWTPTYGATTSERLPDYRRLDLRLMRFVRTPAVLLTSYAEVLNVTDRANTTGWTYDATWAARRPVHTFFARRTIVVGGELQLAR